MKSAWENQRAQIHRTGQSSAQETWVTGRLHVVGVGEFIRRIHFPNLYQDKPFIMPGAVELIAAAPEAEHFPSAEIAIADWITTGAEEDGNLRYSGASLAIRVSGRSSQGVWLSYGVFGIGLSAVNVGSEMRSITNREATSQLEVRIPPGAYVAKFYHEGKLTETISGVDFHPIGARLIAVVVRLVEPSSSGPVTIILLKNDIEFLEFNIEEEETFMQIDLSSTDLDLSMDFEAFADTLRVQVSASGTNASQLSLLGVFDR